ncbi:taste receptor type 2 member 8-like [Heteronotia binoei]|uniref:taste receptor type 2 member 8-like n=1 Tax=Heteronotia binoei TaxID=13085 RepID=UPI002930CC4D|nr:taste receptor type 2 member 8-like [Heteronotia binoei]
MMVVDRNLFSPLGIFFLIVFGIKSIVSLLGNGFILAVNGQSWLRSKKMLPCEFLLTILSLSRFLLQWVIVSSQFVYFSSPETYTYGINQQAFSLSWMYLNIASLWCATWLNVFYCVKVINFAHQFFVWLKPRIGVLVSRFLGISLLAFIICSVPPIMTYYEEKNCRNHIGTLAEDISRSETCGSRLLTKLSPLQFSFTAINFSICLMASLVLLLSLWRHTRNLKKGGLSPKDLSTKAHLRVMKPLLLLLFFYIVHFPAMIIVMGDILQYGKLERLISDIVLASYPSAHSVILIVTNPKLKKAYIHILNLKRSAS